MLFRFFTHWRDSYAGIPRKIWLLALVSLINRCGAMIIIFMTIYLTKHLHYDLRSAGYVLGFFGLGALGGAYLGGRLTDRFGYYPVQLWSLILNGIMLLLMMAVEDFWLMCATVFAMSLVSEIFRPANAVAIVRNSTLETRTRSVSLYRMAVNLGWTIAPALGGPLVAFGWHWLFWADGLTCIAAAVLLRYLLPPKTEVVKAIAELPEKEVSPANLSPYRDRQFMWFAVLTVLNALVFMQFLWTVPIFFKEIYQWDEAAIGRISALNGFIVFAFEMPLIYRLEGRRPQLSFVRIGLILYALSYTMLLLPLAHVWVAVLFMVLISFGEMFVMPFSSNYVYSRMGGQRQGAYTAIYTMTYSLANIIAPLFGTQMVAAYGFHALWYSLGILLVIASVGMWRLQKSGGPIVLAAAQAQVS